MSENKPGEDQPVSAVHGSSQFKQLFDSLQEGFALHEIICDEANRPYDYRFIDVNPAFELLTGYPRKQLVGRTVREVMPGTEDRWIQRYGAVALTGRSDRFEAFAQEIGRHYSVYSYCPQPGCFATLFLDVTDRVLMENELRETNKSLEDRVKIRTQKLDDANESLLAQNEELTAQNEEIAAMSEEITNLNLNLTSLNGELELRARELLAANEELTALNEQMCGLNDCLEVSNRTLANEIVVRRRKEQEVLLREKQYQAITSLLTRPVEDIQGLLGSILQDAVRLVGAPGGYIGLRDDSGRNNIIRHAIGANQVLLLNKRSITEGMLGEVYHSGDFLFVEDYRNYPYAINRQLLDRLTTVLMMPLKLGGEVIGVLAANWQDDVHPVTAEDVEVFRQFAVLASIALERSRDNTKLSRQNLLLQGLAETTASLVNELDLEKVLQNILDIASSFMGIPHGFIQILEPDGFLVRIKCGLGRHRDKVGESLPIDSGGLISEIFRTGKMVVINDYENWPQRLEGLFGLDITAAMQAPLTVDGKTIGSIGLTVFGEPLTMDPEKCAVFEQFATVAAIAVKNVQVHHNAKHQAYHDALTSLPNRSYLNLRLEEEMEKARCGESCGAVIFIDLDDIKTVNDSFGHSYGDGVIKEAAQQIADTAGPEAFVGRAGGDEFLVILPGKDNLTHIAHVAGRLVDASHREYEVGGRNIHMSASIGVTVYPNDGDKAEEILKNADNAMYAAKAAGRNCWRFYEPEMLEDAYAKMVMTNDLRHALERGELFLHYQPQISLGNGEVVGFEALLRWKSREYGMVSPIRFIPLAEQSGLIHSLGRWVIEEACTFAKKMAGMGFRHVHVAVNVSPRQLAAEGFVEIVQQCINDAGISADQLEVEITENVLIDSLEDSTRKLDALSALGVRLSLDDFGTGFSSLTYLRNLPVGTLKIDKSFIDKILEDKVQEGFVGSIIDMAHVLGLNVVAEGVETGQQLEKLTELGCDCIQGYVFSRPVPEAEALCFPKSQPVG